MSIAAGHVQIHKTSYACGETWCSSLCPGTMQAARKSNHERWHISWSWRGVKINDMKLKRSKSVNQPLTCTLLLPVSVCVTLLCVSCTWNPTVFFFCDQTFSLSVSSSVHAYYSMCQNSLPFSDWGIFRRMYVPRFAHTFIYWRTLELLQLLAIVCNTALNVCILYLFEALLSVFWICTQKWDWWIIWLFCF